MNHLVILAHPNPSSFCHALCQTAAEALSQSGRVQIRDLYQLEFDPVLTLSELKGKTDLPELEAERELVRWADHLLFVFPVWWYDRPAILKGWVDRVLSYGFAYRVEKGRGVGLLTGKTATVVATFGSRAEEIEALSPAAVDWVMEAMARGTLEYCGFSDVTRRPLFALDKAAQEERLELLHSFGSDLKERYISKNT